MSSHATSGIGCNARIRNRPVLRPKVASSLTAHLALRPCTGQFSHSSLCCSYRLPFLFSLPSPHFGCQMTGTSAQTTLAAMLFWKFVIFGRRLPRPFLFDSLLALATQSTPLLCEQEAILLAWAKSEVTCLARPLPRGPRQAPSVLAPFCYEFKWTMFRPRNPTGQLTTSFSFSFCYHPVPLTRLPPIHIATHHVCSSFSSSHHPPPLCTFCPFLLHHKAQHG